MIHKTAILVTKFQTDFGLCLVHALHGQFPTGTVILVLKAEVDSADFLRN